MAKTKNLIIPSLKSYQRKQDALFISLNTKELNKTINKKLDILTESSKEQTIAFNALAKELIRVASKEGYIPYKPKYRLKNKMHKGRVLTGYHDTVGPHKSLKSLNPKFRVPQMIDATPYSMAVTDKHKVRKRTRKKVQGPSYLQTVTTVEYEPRNAIIGIDTAGNSITQKRLLTARNKILSMANSATDKDRKASLKKAYLHGGIESARKIYGYINKSEEQYEKWAARNGGSTVFKNPKTVKKKRRLQGRLRSVYKTATVKGEEHLARKYTKQGISKYTAALYDTKHRAVNDKVVEITPHISDINTWQITKTKVPSIVNNSHKNASNRIYGANNNVYVGYQYFNERYAHFGESTDMNDYNEPPHTLQGTSRWFEVLMNEYQTEDADYNGLTEQRDKIINNSKYADIILKALKK